MHWTKCSEDNKCVKSERKQCWVVKLIRFVSLYYFFSTSRSSQNQSVVYLSLISTTTQKKLSKIAKLVFKVLAKCCVYLCVSVSSEVISTWTTAKPKKDNGLLWQREWTSWSPCWSALVQINEASAELSVCFMSVWCVLLYISAVVIVFVHYCAVFSRMPGISKLWNHLRQRVSWVFNEAVCIHAGLSENHPPELEKLI